jgi:hypothetical protein
MLALLLGALAVAPLSAQTPKRSGFWLGVGAGWGSARLNCNICQKDRDDAVSGYAQLGYTVTPQFLLGLESNLWYNPGTPTDQTMGTIGLIGQFYPSASNGLYFKIGANLAKYWAKDDARNEFKTKAVGGLVGVGYEVPIGTNLTIAPFVTVLGSANSDFTYNDTKVNGSANTSLIQLGLGFTWH